MVSYFDEPEAYVAKDGPWKPPPDGNYSTWQANINTRVNQHCSSSNSFANVAKNHRKLSYFNSNFYGQNADVLEQKMEEDDIMGYVYTQTFWIFLLVLGIGALIAACVLAGCFSKKMRSCGKSCYCGKCLHDRPRKPVTSSNWKDCIPLTWAILFSLFGVIFVLVFAAVALASAVDMRAGFDGVSCDGWQTVSGYFYGVQDMDIDSDMTNDWKGTVAQYEAMHVLRHKVEPIELNPIRVEVLKEYERIKTLFTELAVNQTTDMAHEMYVVRDMQDTMAELSTEYGFRTPYMALLGNTFDAKILEWIEETIDTSWVGLEMMALTLDKYLSPDSLMLQNSYNMTTIALSAIQDVDYSFAGVSYSIDNVSEGLGGKITALFAVLVLWSTLAIVLSIAGVVIMVLFYKRAYTDKDEAKARGMQKHFGGLFCGYGGFVGLGLVFAGICWLLGSVLGDACAVVDDALFTRGNWEALDSEMWNITVTNSTDLRAVFSTCIAETGDGDVATTLGLRQMTEALEEEIDSVKQELRAIPPKLLLEYKQYLTVIVHGLMVDTPVLWAAFRDDEARPLTYDDTKYVMPSLLTDPLKSPRLLICTSLAFAYLPDPIPSVMECVKQEFVFTIHGTNNLVDRINSEAAKATTGTDVVKAWCMRIGVMELQEEGQDLCPSGAVVIAHDTNKDDLRITTTADAVAAATGVPDDRARFIDACILAIEIEQLLNHPIPARNPDLGNYLKCPNEGQGCRFVDVKRDMMVFYDEKGQVLRDTVQTMIDESYGYIEDYAIGIMEDLLQDGYDALANFNCQFVSDALKDGLAEKLCENFSPELPWLGLSAFLVFIGTTFGYVLCWLMWHYLRDLNTEGAKEGDEAEKSLVAPQDSDETYEQQNTTETMQTEQTDATGEEDDTSS